MWNVSWCQWVRSPTRSGFGSRRRTSAPFSRVTVAIAERILGETTTAGVRYYPVRRLTLKREQVTVATSFGEVAVKQITGGDGQVRLVPEFEECRRIARQRNIPIRVVYDTIQREAGPRPAIDKPTGGL